MSHQKAEVFYHVEESYKQQIIVDADQIKGNIVFPQLEKKTVTVRDIRNHINDFSFEKNSFEFFNFETRDVA